MSDDCAPDLLKQLVAIPSVNPGFSEAPEGCGGEGPLADFLMAFAGEHEIEAERFEAAPGRPCVLLSTGPADAPQLCCTAHMDTVWVPAMAEPFRLKKRGTLWHGLGAADDKGSLASALSALLVLRDRKPACRFHLLATCDEEYGLTGIRYMIPERIRPDAVIVMEPTGLRAVAAHKGSSRFTFAIRGKSAHSSIPSRGMNAVYRAARLITALEEFSIRLSAERPHPLLGSGTLTVGTVHGGIQPSSVPDFCTFSVNYRLLPGETIASVTARLQSVLTPCGVPYEISDALLDAVPLETDLSHPLVVNFRKVLKKNALPDTPCGVPYAAESSRCAECGIPAILFGPGSIDCAHTPEEAVDPVELRRAAEVLASFAMEGLPF